MNLNDYQKESRKTAVYPNRTTDGLTYSVLALCGETGELANKLKKHLRAGTTPNRLILADELGDCLWYVASVAQELGYSLEEIAHMNLFKLSERYSKKEAIG